MQKPPVEVAFERDDQLREPARLDPLPGAEFGMLRLQVDVLVAAKEAS